MTLALDLYSLMSDHPVRSLTTYRTLRGDYLRPRRPFSLASERRRVFTLRGLTITSRSRWRDPSRDPTRCDVACRRAHTPTRSRVSAATEREGETVCTLSLSRPSSTFVGVGGLSWSVAARHDGGSRGRYIFGAICSLSFVASLSLSRCRFDRGASLSRSLSRPLSPAVLLAHGVRRESRPLVINGRRVRRKDNHRLPVTSRGNRGGRLSGG